jgi:alkylation response protein AidB-like acyl-CoA dehydrogenase
MVSFELSDEQREIRDWVHDFAEKEIRPFAVQYDESEEFPWPVVKKAAEVGLYGVDFLQQTYADATGIMPALVAEELTWGCAGIALAIQGTGPGRRHLLPGHPGPDLAPGSRPVRHTWRSRARGVLRSLSPNAGSDVSVDEDRAVRKNGEWVINGQKIFITNGGIADVHGSWPRWSPSWAPAARQLRSAQGPRGPAHGQEGKEDGIRASHTAEVLLEDCTIPAENVLGGIEEARGPAGAPARGRRSARRRHSRPSSCRGRSWAPRRSASPALRSSSPLTTPSSASSSAAH